MAKKYFIPRTLTPTAPPAAGASVKPGKVIGATPKVFVPRVNKFAAGTTFKTVVPTQPVVAPVVSGPAFQGRPAVTDLERARMTKLPQNLNMQASQAANQRVGGLGSSYLPLTLPQFDYVAYAGRPSVTATEQFNMKNAVLDKLVAESKAPLPTTGVTNVKKTVNTVINWVKKANEWMNSPTQLAPRNSRGEACTPLMVPVGATVNPRWEKMDTTKYSIAKMDGYTPYLIPWNDPVSKSNPLAHIQYDKGSVVAEALFFLGTLVASMTMRGTTPEQQRKLNEEAQQKLIEQQPSVPVGEVTARSSPLEHAPTTEEITTKVKANIADYMTRSASDPKTYPPLTAAQQEAAMQAGIAYEKAYWGGTTPSMQELVNSVLKTPIVEGDTLRYPTISEATKAARSIYSEMMVPSYTSDEAITPGLFGMPRKSFTTNAGGHYSEVMQEVARAFPATGHTIQASSQELIAEFVASNAPMAVTQGLVANVAAATEVAQLAPVAFGSTAGAAAALSKIGNLINGFSILAASLDVVRSTQAVAAKPVTATSTTIPQLPITVTVRKNQAQVVVNFNGQKGNDVVNTTIDVEGWQQKPNHTQLVLDAMKAKAPDEQTVKLAKTIGITIDKAVAQATYQQGAPLTMGTPLPPTTAVEATHQVAAGMTKPVTPALQPTKTFLPRGLRGPTGIQVPEIGPVAKISNPEPSVSTTQAPSPQPAPSFNAVRPTLTPEETRIVNATSRARGAVGAKAVVPAVVARIAKPGDTILDYGAGKDAMHTLALREQGLNVTAYDTGANVVEGLHDTHALDRQYDTVYASNVLNVLPSINGIRYSIDEMASAVKPGGRLIVNYPAEPRKYTLTVSQMKDELLKKFGSVERISGTNAAPVWEATEPLAVQQQQETVVQQTRQEKPGVQREKPSVERVTGERYTKIPGTGAYVEMVPVATLMKMREYDRAWTPEIVRSSEYLTQLKDDILRNGVKEPVMIAYEPETGLAYVVEGNHRVMLANDLGIKELPAFAIRSEEKGVHHTVGVSAMQLKAWPADGPYLGRFLAPSSIGLETNTDAIRSGVGIGENDNEVSPLAPGQEQKVTAPAPAPAAARKVFAPRKARGAREGVLGQRNAREYGITHRPSPDGPPAYDLLSTDLAPRDIYEHPEYYTGNWEPGAKGVAETLETLNAIRGDPDAEIWVYRGGPKGELNKGDWISLSYDYAHSESPVDEKGHLQQAWAFKVKARDVKWAGDVLEEFGYYPSTDKTVEGMKALRQMPILPWDTTTMQEHQVERWNKLVQNFPNLAAIHPEFVNGLLRATERDLEGEGVESGKDYTVAGSTRLALENGVKRVLITLYSNADEYVVMEEALHAGWLALTKADRAAFTKYYETKHDARSVEEYFAQEGVDWLAGRTAADPEATTVWQKIAKWLVSMFERLLGQGENQKVQAIYQRAMAAAGSTVDPDFLHGDASVVMNNIQVLTMNGYALADDRAWIPPEDGIIKVHAIVRSGAGIGTPIDMRVPAKIVDRAIDETDIDEYHQLQEMVTSNSTVADQMKLMGKPDRFMSGGLTREVMLKLGMLTPKAYEALQAAGPEKRPASKTDQVEVMNFSTYCGRDAATIAYLFSGKVPREMAIRILSNLASCHGGLCYVNFMGPAGHWAVTTAVKAALLNDEEREEAADAFIASAKKIFGKKFARNDLLLDLGMRKTATGHAKKATPFDIKDSAVAEWLAKVYKSAPIADQIRFSQSLGKYMKKYVPQEAGASRSVSREAAKRWIENYGDQWGKVTQAATIPTVRMDQSGDFLLDIMGGGVLEWLQWIKDQRALFEKTKGAEGRDILMGDNGIRKKIIAITDGWYWDVPLAELKDVAAKYGDMLIVHSSGGLDFQPWEVPLRNRGFEKLAAAGFNVFERHISDQWGQLPEEYSSAEGISSVFEHALRMMASHKNLTAAHFIETALHHDMDQVSKLTKATPENIAIIIKWYTEQYNATIEEAAAHVDAILNANRARMQGEKATAAGEKPSLTPEGINRSGHDLMSFTYERMEKIGVSADLIKRMKAAGFNGGIIDYGDGQKGHAVFPLRCCRTGSCEDCVTGCGFHAANYKIVEARVSAMKVSDAEYYISDYEEKNGPPSIETIEDAATSHEADIVGSRVLKENEQYGLTSRMREFWNDYGVQQLESVAPSTLVDYTARGWKTTHARTPSEFKRWLENIPGQTPLSEMPPTERGNAISEAIRKRGYTDLRGSDVPDIKAMAALAQVLRNPMFETFTYLLVHKGVLVDQIAISCGLPGQVSFPEGQQLQDIINRIAAIPAEYAPDTLYVMHNHPNFDAAPSMADMVTTNQLVYPFAYQLGLEFGGHIIVDHNQYAVLAPSVYDAQTITGTAVPAPSISTELEARHTAYETNWQLPRDVLKEVRGTDSKGVTRALFEVRRISNEDLRGTPAVDHPIIGQHLGYINGHINWDDLATLWKSYRTDEQAVTIFYSDFDPQTTKQVVRGYDDVGLGWIIRNPVEFMEYLREQRLHIKGGQAITVVIPEETMEHLTLAKREKLMKFFGELHDYDLIKEAIVAHVTYNHDAVPVMIATNYGKSKTYGPLEGYMLGLTEDEFPLYMVQAKTTPEREVYRDAEVASLRALKVHGSTPLGKKADRLLYQPIKTVGRTISDDILNRGYVDLRGRLIAGEDDLAEIAQVLRSPLMETFSIFFIKNGRITDQRALTSFLHDMVAFPPGFFEEMEQWIKTGLADGTLDADSFYIMHNHPSGFAQPSHSDFQSETSFIEMARRVGLKWNGEIVLDHNEYAFIQLGKGLANTQYVTHPSRPSQPEELSWEKRTTSNEDFWSNPAVAHPLIGQRWLGSRDVTHIAHVALTARGNEEVIQILYANYDVNTKERIVTSVDTVGLRFILDSPDYMMKYIADSMSGKNAAQIAYLVIPLEQLGLMTKKERDIWESFVMRAVDRDVVFGLIFTENGWLANGTNKLQQRSVEYQTREFGPEEGYSQGHELEQVGLEKVMEQGPQEGPRLIPMTDAMAQQMATGLDTMMKFLQKGPVTKTVETNLQSAFRKWLKNLGLPSDALNWYSVLSWYKNVTNAKTAVEKVDLIKRAIDRYNTRKQKAWDEQQARKQAAAERLAKEKGKTQTAAGEAAFAKKKLAEMTTTAIDEMLRLRHEQAMHNADVQRFQLAAIRREQQIALQRQGEAWVRTRQRLLQSLDRSIGAVEANVRKSHTIDLAWVQVIRDAVKGLVNDRKIDRNAVRFLTNEDLAKLRVVIKDAIAIGRMDWLQEKANRDDLARDTKQRIAGNLHPIVGRQELKRGEGELEPSVDHIARTLNEAKRLGIGLTPMESVFRGMGDRELYIEMLTGLSDARMAADAWRKGRLDKAKELGVDDGKSQQRIGVWLINQTSGGRRHLIEGNKLTEDEIDAIVLTDKEQQYAAYVRQHFDETFPMLAEYFRQIYNVELNREDMYISLFNSGKFNDSFSVNAIVQQMPMQAGGRRKTPAVPMAKPRIGGTNPVLINVFEIGDRYDETVAYALHMGPRLIKWWDIVEDPDIQAALGNLGTEIHKDYLTSLSLRGGPGGGRTQSGFDIVADALRRNFSRAQILFRPTSALLQFAQVVNVAAFTGPGPILNAAGLLMDTQYRDWVTANFPLLRDDMKGYFEVLNLTEDKLSEIGGWFFRNCHQAARVTGALANYIWLMQKAGKTFDIEEPPDKDLLIESMAMIEMEFGPENIASRPAVLESGYGLFNDRSLGRLLLQFQTDTLAKWSMAKDLLRELPEDPARSLAGLFWLILVATMLLMPLVRRMWRKLTGGTNPPLYQESLEALLEVVPFMNGVQGILSYGQIPIPAISSMVDTVTSLNQMLQYQSMSAKVRAGGRAASGVGAMFGVPGIGTAGGVFDNVMKFYAKRNTTSHGSGVYGRLPTMPTMPTLPH